MNGLPWRTVIFLIGALALNACVPFNRWYDMEAIVNGRDVAFTLPASDLDDKDVRFILNGIDVTKRGGDCPTSCGVWEMSRPADRAVTLTSDNFVQFPIKYGVRLPNMENRILKPLTSGKYVAHAGFTHIKNGKVIGSKQVATDFDLE